MKDFLLQLFEFNNITNINLLGKIWELPQKDKALYLFSHLINSQDKWLARLKANENALFMDFFAPVYTFQELETEWKRSIGQWVIYLQEISEEKLQSEVEYKGAEGNRFAAKPVDIVLQLNFHSIHHRAQVQTILREQGIQPGSVDYIATRYRRLD